MSSLRRLNWKVGAESGKLAGSQSRQMPRATRGHVLSRSTEPNMYYKTLSIIGGFLGHDLGHLFKSFDPRIAGPLYELFHRHARDAV
jgi:hypothetical protein